MAFPTLCQMFVTLTMHEIDVILSTHLLKAAMSAILSQTEDAPRVLLYVYFGADGKVHLKLKHKMDFPASDEFLGHHSVTVVAGVENCLLILLLRCTDPCDLPLMLA